MTGLKNDDFSSCGSPPSYRVSQEVGGKGDSSVTRLVWLWYGARKQSRSVPFIMGWLVSMKQLQTLILSKRTRPVRHVQCRQAFVHVQCTKDMRLSTFATTYDSKPPNRGHAVINKAVDKSRHANPVQRSHLTCKANLPGLPLWGCLYARAYGWENSGPGWVPIHRGPWGRWCLLT